MDTITPIPGVSKTAIDEDGDAITITQPVISATTTAINISITIIAITATTIVVLYVVRNADLIIIYRYGDRMILPIINFYI